MAKTDRRLEELEQIIGLRFKNRALLREALTHRSYLNEAPEPNLAHNERLEFLGDAVLEYVVVNFLFRHKPPYTEGEMTQLKSALVSIRTLALLGEDLSLSRYVYLSRGEGQELSAGSRSRPIILGNAVEAIIGAINVDRGMGAAELFILEFILPRLQQIIASGAHIDPKTRLHELAQEKLGLTPRYELLLQQGPEHDRIHVVGVYFDGKQIAIGKGSSKQLAEMEAARKALQTEYGINPPV